MSADDGQRLLWLDFGGDEGEQVRSHTLTILKLLMIVFVMYAKK